MKETNWQKKEARELFANCVNSLLMRLPEGKGADMDYILKTAQQAVDTAFKLYGNEPEENEPANLDFK